MSESQSRESITVYSDYVCPFCYLGRASLRQYQATRETELAVDWHPFDLRSGKRNPDGSIDHAVDDGKDEEYYEQAKQGVRRLQERYDVEMELDIAEDIDSLRAQVLSYTVKQTEPYETWLTVDEGLFEALWTDGRDIGETDVLVDVAADAGIERSAVESILADESNHEAVRERFEAARRRGITGVPTFVYDGHSARGAVPPEQLSRLVDGL